MSTGWSWFPIALVGLGITTWAGTVVVCCICKALEQKSLGLRMALGFGNGAGLLSLSLFILGTLHIPFSTPLLVGMQVVPALLAAFLASGFAPLSTRDPDRSRPAVFSASIWPFRHVPVNESIMENPSGTLRRIHLLLLGLVGLAVFTMGWVSVREKASFVDSRTVWMLKARVFYLDRGFDGQYFKKWTDPAERRTYPPLVPLYGAYMHGLCGGLDDGAVKLAQAAFTLSLVILLYRMLASRCGRLTAALAVLLFVLCGQTITLSIWGTADLQLAFYLLGAAWGLIESIRSGARSGLVLAGLFMAFGVFTKDEGLGASLCLVLAFLLAGRPWQPSKSGGVAARTLATLLPLLVTPLLVAAAWSLFCSARGLEGHLLDRAPLQKLFSNPELLAERTGFVVKSYLEEIVNPRWIFAWPLFLLAVAGCILRRPSDGTAFLGLFVPLLLLLYGLVYIILARHVEWHVQTSISRIFYHPFPVLYYFTLVHLAGKQAA